MKKLYPYIISTAILSSTLSCSKFLDIPAPTTNLVDRSVFADSSTATAAVLGLYYKAMENGLGIWDGGGTMCAGLQSDELLLTSLAPTIQEFYFYGLTPTNSLVTSYWTELYQIVYQANAILDQLVHSTKLSATLVEKLSGEAYLMRGLALYRLQHWYGAIPMPLTPDFTTTAQLERTPEAAVWEQVASDWRKAAELLPEGYGSVNKTRPTRYAALGLLSRVYLLQGKWAEAEAAVTAIVAANQNYSLAEAPNQVFSVNSPETIWQLRPVEPNANTSISSLLGQREGVPPFATYQPGFVADMDDSDLRKQQWIYTYEEDGTRYWQPMKYQYPNTSLGTEYLVLIRLGELYLNRAEACIQQNKLSAAVADINLIRARAGLAPIAENDHLMEQLMQERKWELQVEQDFRWTDLKRWGKLGEIAGALKPNDWKPTAAVLPLPQVELNNNPTLTQNPGY